MQCKCKIINKVINLYSSRERRNLFLHILLLLCAPPVPVAHIIVFSEVKVAVPLDNCPLYTKGNLFYSKMSENLSPNYNEMVK